MSNSKENVDKNISILSHGTAVILLILYVLYLFFQLRTHANLFDAELASEGLDEEREQPQLSAWAAGGVLFVVTILVAVCAEYLVGSIDSFAETVHVSKTFIGFIILPIVGNAAEHITAIVVTVKDKMDLATSVTIGNCMQIALLVTPILVLLGWAIGVDISCRCACLSSAAFIPALYPNSCLFFFKPAVYPNKFPCSNPSLKPARELFGFPSADSSPMTVLVSLALPFPLFARPMS